MNICEEYHINNLEFIKLKNKLSNLKESARNYCNKTSLASHEIYTMSDNGIDIKIFGDDAFSNSQKILILKYRPNVDFYKYFKPEYSLELTEQILQILSSDKLTDSIKESFINMLVIES